MKNILITGVAGFIGSHLADYFLNEGCYVIGIDNYLTGNFNNIKHLSSNSNFKIIEEDVCNKLTINEDIDYILHFASPASPSDYLNYPIKTLRTGSLGTENILKLALEKKSIILVASTSEVYGDPKEHPQRETYYGNVNPIGPRGVYDEAKRYLEALTTAYKNVKKLDIRIARIFNTYGPRMRKNDGRAIPNFINQALNKRKFTVYGDGSQTRSFCYIDDTVQGIVKLLESNYSLPVNIGNPRENSISDLVNLISKLTNTENKIIYCDLPKNDPKVRQPCIEIALKKLNWKPKIELIDGLKKTILFYENE